MEDEDKIKAKEDSEERFKLDPILKSLFNVSRKVLIGMMNSLFKENYDLENTEITKRRKRII